MEQADLVRHAIIVFEEIGISYMVVGSIASGAYGEPRLTQDIDIVASLNRDDVWGLKRAFPEPDFYLSVEAMREAISSRTQFNIIHPESGNKIDVMVSPMDTWGRTQLSRRQKIKLFPDLEGYAARPEDVMLSKMLYYREGGSEKHLRDIAGIVRVQADALDRDYVAEWAEKLGVADIWHAVLRRLSRDQA